MYLTGSKTASTVIDIGTGLISPAAALGMLTKSSTAIARISQIGRGAGKGTKVIDNLGDVFKITNAPSSGPQIIRNSIQGELGEAAVRQRLLGSRSVDLVGEQMRINTPGVGSHRVTDFLVRGKNTGQLRIIEVKTGGATRDAVQLAKDKLIANPLSPTTFSGRRANAAGFPNGTPTGPIRTYEVNASNLNR